LPLRNWRDGSWDQAHDISGQRIAETIFQPMINAIERLAPLARRFFQGMVIGALLVAVAVLKVRNWLRDTFGGSDILKGFDAQRAALYAGVFAFGVLAAAIGFVGLTMALALVPLAALVGALYGLGKVALAVYNFFAELDWAALGRSIVDGIVGGIKGAARWVWDAMKGLASSATTAFKKALGIASPSKEFQRLGLTLPQGVASGVDAGAPQVDAAVSDMVDVPEGGGRAALGAATSVSVGEVHIHTTAASGEDIARDLKRELERILRGVAVSMGAPVPGGA
jgi:hypothetical protein